MNLFQTNSTAESLLSGGRGLARSLATLLALAVVPVTRAADNSQTIDFERDVRPIFAEKCTLCHGPDDAKGGLRLTDLENASIELKSGLTAIVPGDVRGVVCGVGCAVVRGVAWHRGGRSADFHGDGNRRHARRRVS